MSIGENLIKLQRTKILLDYYIIVQKKCFIIEMKQYLKICIGLILIQKNNYKKTNSTIVDVLLELKNYYPITFEEVLL